MVDGWWSMAGPCAIRSSVHQCSIRVLKNAAFNTYDVIITIKLAR